MTTVENIGLVFVCLVVFGGMAAFALVVFHQRRLVASDGGLAVALKRGEERWANGVARYAGDHLVWYRTLSLSPKADLRMHRKELKVVSSRVWDARRDNALRPNTSVVECRLRNETISLGFPDNGLTGFLSWLEASAPRA